MEKKLKNRIAPRFSFFAHAVARPFAFIYLFQQIIIPLPIQPSLLSEAQAAGTYYVAKNAANANDTNPGTEALPWKTLTKAGNVAQAGDTVIVKAGTYNETLRPSFSGIPGNLIIFKAFPDDACRGDSSAKAKELKTNCKVIIDGENIRDYGVNLYQRNYIRIEGLDIRNTKDHLIYVQGYGETGAAGLEIMNNYIHDGKRGENANTGAIEAVGTLDTILIENNEIMHVYNALRIGKGNNVTLRGNHIWDIDCDAIGHGIAYNMTIENNYIHGPTFTTSCHQDGLDLYPQKHLQGNINLVIRNNWIFNFTQLIYIVPCCDGSEASDTNFSGIKIYGNVLYTATYLFPPGIFLDMSWDKAEDPTTPYPDPIINFNVRDIDIHSNTCGWLGTYPCIRIQKKEGRIVDHVTIRNNIMYDNHGIDVDPAGGITNVSSDYNLFYNANPPSYEGAHSLRNTNPNFMSYASGNTTGNFHLQSSSLAINNGSISPITTPAQFKDIDGIDRPQGSILDMGAHEFSNGGSNPVNNPPILNPIGNQQITAGTSRDVNISASDPDGNTLSFQLSAPVSWITLTDNGNGTAVLRLNPGLSNVGTYYPVVISAADNGSPARTTTEDITVTVTAPAANITPIANAGGNQTVSANSLVTLNGSGSSDPDNGPQSIQYAWLQNPNDTIRVSLAGASTSTATFIAPAVAATLHFALTVFDGANMNVQEITIIVNAVSTSPGPVSQWRMDGNIQDSVGSNHGIIGGVNNNTNCTVPGRMGSGCGFDGAGDWIDFGTSSSINFVNNFSIGLWLKTAATTSATVYSRDISPGQLVLAIYSGGLAFKTGGSGWVSGGPIVNDNQWHQVTLTVDASGNANVYLDGLVRMTATGASVNAPGTRFRAGMTSSGSEAFNGTLDEMAIWNRALSVTEIAQLATVVPQNQPPVVTASTDQVIASSDTVSLYGIVTDDGLPNPPGAVSATWSKVSGPGNVIFGNANAANTTAKFSMAGTYVLRFTANDGALNTSQDVQVAVSASAFCVVAGNNTWQNTSFPAQTGIFTAQFDATPENISMDGIVTLSQNASSGINGQTAVRFYKNNRIYVRNGNVFSAQAIVGYTPGKTYHFRVQVNVATRKYSVWVTPRGGTEIQLASNYAFRSSTTSLSNSGVWANQGSSLESCNFSITS